MDKNARNVHHKPEFFRNDASNPTVLIIYSGEQRRKHMPDRLSLGYLTYGEHDPIAVIEAARSAGFNELGIRLHPAGPDQPIPRLGRDHNLRKTVSQCLADNGMAVSDVELVRINADFAIPSVAEFFDQAAEMGGRHVLIAGDDEEHSRLRDNFAVLCAYAAKYGMTADLEFMPWTAVRDVRSANRIVEKSIAENGGVLIDALHFQKSASSLTDVAAVPAGRLHYLQLCDGPAEFDISNEAMIYSARHDRLLPGDGDIDLIGLCAAMPPDFTFCAEVPNDRMLDELGINLFLRNVHDHTRAVLKRCRPLSR